MAYTLVHDDIDEDLVRYIDPRLVEGTALFYVRRQHWIDLVQEGLVSLALAGTLLAVLANYNPVLMCRTTDCRVLSAGLILLAFLAVIAFPFGVEVWRWQRHIFYLTNNGLSEWAFIIFPLRRFGFHNNVLGFLSSSDVSPSELYRWLGVDVGRVSVKSVDESRRSSPLMPHPFQLQARFNEAKNYKPAPPKLDEKPWTT
jgi:hypothetical protein